MPGDSSGRRRPVVEIQLLKDVWQERRTLPLSLAVALLCLASRGVSLLTGVTWVKHRFGGGDGSDEDWIIELYVLFWLVLLVVIVVALPKGGDLGLACVAVALYRLQDLVLSTFDDSLQLTRRFAGIDGASKVIFALVNLVQIVLIFAVTYAVLTVPSDWVGVHQALGPFESVVLSWKGLIPFAVSESAQTTRAQVLTMVESAVAVVVLLIALTRFLSFTPPSRWTRRRRPTGWGTSDAAGRSPRVRQSTGNVAWSRGRRLPVLPPDRRGGRHGQGRAGHRLP